MSRLVGDMRTGLIAVALLGLVVALPLAADTAVGTITSLYGTVEIDAFGKGAFIAAMRGDRLHNVTVIRTAAASGATIELLGKASQIPPDTTFRIVDAMEGQRRTTRLDWFPALLGVLKDAVASFGSSGSDVMLGSKATSVGEYADEWIVEEEDPAALLLDAREAAREGDCLRAISILDAIPVLRGSAYFGLGDYATARMHLAKAEPLIRDSADRRAREILPVLLFQLGASRFFIGEDGAAIDALSSFVALEVDGPFAPYAYQLLLTALVSRGDRDRALEVLARAKARFADTTHEREFQSLPPAP